MGTDMGFPVEAFEETKIKCPRCESEVPSSIYCVACGCPMEMEVSPKEDSGSEELRFDLNPLTEMQGEGEPRVKEVMAEPRFAPMESTVQGVNNDFEPMEKESLITTHAVEVMEPKDLDDEIEDSETGLQDNSEPEEEILQAEEPEGPDPAIEKLATELLKSVYLELWSVGLLREEWIGEEQFLRTFDAYHDRVEKCIGQRAHLLNQISDLEAYEAKMIEAMIELDELDVRRSLGDLYEGEYEAMAPARRWTIEHSEAETEDRRGRIALLEDPIGLMPPGKVEEATALMVEDLVLIREAETSARLSSGTAAKVRASVEMIEGLLRRPPQ
jgi:hypothetical protein